MPPSLTNDELRELRYNQEALARQDQQERYRQSQAGREAYDDSLRSQIDRWNAMQERKEQYSTLQQASIARQAEGRARQAASAQALAERIRQALAGGAR